MAWSTIRKATEEDYQILEQRAMAFCARHGLDIDEGYLQGQSKANILEDTLRYDVQHSANPEQARYLLQLWKRIVKRSLSHRWAEGIAHGYVGFHVD